jgi:hypothetical protein
MSFKTEPAAAPRQPAVQVGLPLGRELVAERPRGPLEDRNDKWSKGILHGGKFFLLEGPGFRAKRTLSQKIDA